jgi:LmbE family N-acetylglucosaminyl deacetylase
LKTLLAVSPHLDDAIFSAGALLARHAQAGWRVIVATCFTASIPHPTGFALACQTDKGIGPETDYMDLRREEDRQACALLGAEPIHLLLPEAPHRGYGSPAALFGPRLTCDGVAYELAEALGTLIGSCRPDLILGPAAIGDHVDHWIVRETLSRVSSSPAALWADLPYAARHGSALPETFARLPCGPHLSRKLQAARAYRSQLGFQFGTAQAMPTLLSIDAAEGFAFGPAAAPARKRA